MFCTAGEFYFKNDKFHVVSQRWLSQNSTKGRSFEQNFQSELRNVGTGAKTITTTIELCQDNNNWEDFFNAEAKRSFAPVAIQRKFIVVL